MSAPHCKVILVKGTPEESGEIFQQFFKHFRHHEPLGEPYITQKLVHDSLGSWNDPSKYVEIILARKDNVHGQLLGTCMYHKVFSFYRGKIILMEQFFVEPEFRGHKIGYKLMKQLAQIAKSEDAIIEWTCRDWNVNALKFYKSIGGQEVAQSVLLESGIRHIGFRLDRDRVQQLIDSNW